MPVNPQYLVLPVCAYGDYTLNFNDAKAKAEDSAAKYVEDFVVLRVEYLGTYQHVSPIWTTDAPFENPPTIPVNVDDEVPF